MPQVCIDRFDRVSFLFVRSHFIGSAVIQRIVDWKGIAIVLFGLRSPLQTGLQSGAGSFADHIPTQDTARVSVNYGQNVDFVFFCPTKVYNSSNSAFLTLAGTGADGRLAVC